MLLQRQGCNCGVGVRGRIGAQTRPRSRDLSEHPAMERGCCLGLLWRWAPSAPPPRPPTALTGLALSQPLGRVGARRAPPMLLLLLVARSFLRPCCWSKLGAEFHGT